MRIIPQYFEFVQITHSCFKKWLKKKDNKWKNTPNLEKKPKTLTQIDCRCVNPITSRLQLNFGLYAFVFSQNKHKEYPKLMSIQQCTISGEG